jgi:two-component system, LytTR family, response regulator
MSGVGMKLRAVIVDDEPLARERLRRLLAEDEGIDVVAECRNGKETIARLKTEKVDLLFLDIQMPAGGGFEVIDAVGVRHMPPTVFVTAYEQYAIQAFKVHAIDYLTKPIETERLRETLDRAKARIAGEAALQTQEQLAAALDALRGGVRNGKSYQERFLIRDGNKETLVQVGDVEWIEAADYYSCLHVGGRQYMLRESIKELSNKLDPAQFVRIHRSAIVPIRQVKEIHRDGRAEYFVVLHGGQRLRMSKAGWQNLIAASGS